MKMSLHAPASEGCCWGMQVSNTDKTHLCRNALSQGSYQAQIEKPLKLAIFLSLW